MISAAEARRQVNQEMTQQAEQQLKHVEETIAKAIKDKQLSCSVSGVLVQPVKAKLLKEGYDVKETEENERGMYYTITTISF